MNGVAHPQATEAARGVARDLVLLAADVLTVEEVAARAGLSVAQVESLVADPDVILQAQKESAKARLEGALGRFQAIAIRDKALSLLAGRLNDDMSTRALLDVVNTVRPVAVKEDVQARAEAFSLTIVMGAQSMTLQSAPADVVDVDAKPLGGE